MDDRAPSSHTAGPSPDAAPAAPADAVCAGATLGDYRLDALLARQAHADVYDATHLPSGTPRVVYVVSPHAMQDHPLVHRVVCEVDAARWLRHPAAAKVDGYGDAPGGRMYVAAERAPGRSLAARLAAGERLTPRRVVRLACRLVEALEEAHAVGLVHGHLTPEAIVVGDDADATGAPLVTITGLGVSAVAYAAVLADAERPYVAPERQGGAAAEVQDDVFGLASVLWAALAGGAPADDVERADVPGADVLRAARSAEPARRPASVRAFWEELLGALVADAATPAGSPAPTLPAFDLADLELAPVPLAPSPEATDRRGGGPAAPGAELSFGGVAVWAVPVAVGPDAAVAPAPAPAYPAPAYPAPAPPPERGHLVAYDPGAPRPRAAPPAPARTYRWAEQYRPAITAARPPARPARAWSARQALPWWLAVPAVAAAAVGGPLARDWAYPNAAPEAHGAGEVADTYQPPRRALRRPRHAELPADTTVVDTLPAVPWVELPEVELPAAPAATRAVVRPDDFARGLSGGLGPR